MNRKIALIFALPLALGLSTAWAQNGDEDYGLPGPAADEADVSDVMNNENAQKGLETAHYATMRVMDDAEAGRPDAVTANIPLPPGEEEDTEAVENAQTGLERAAQGGVPGIENAKSATAEQANYAAQDALNAAQEAIEQRVRGGPPEDLPTPPDVPEPPTP